MTDKSATHPRLAWAGVFMLAFFIATGVAASASGPKHAKIDPATKNTFDSTCATCHGTDGAGTPLGKTLQAADLRSPEIQKLPAAEMIQAVTNGKGNMPPFKGKLSDKEIHDLIDYVRTLGTRK